MNYNKLFKDINHIVNDALLNKQSDNNLNTTQSYWEIGERIVTEEQQGQERAMHGQEILKKLAIDLKTQFGKGFGLASLKYMRQFYRVYKKTEITPRLNWSHYRILIQIEDVRQRKKLESQVIKSGWSKRKLAEQVGLIQGTVNDDSIKVDLQRPFGKTGLMQVRRIIQSGKEQDFIDLGFHIRVYALPGELDGLKDRSVLQPGKNGNLKRVAPYSGNRKNQYVYKASLDHVVDGDTIAVFIECGLGIQTRQILRLRAINAPALTELAGVKARDGLLQMLKKTDTMLIKTRKRDQYSRYIADVFLPKKGMNVNDALENGLYLNQELLDRGFVDRAT